MVMSGYFLTAVCGETWDGIAREIYGHERYAADLICANPSLSDKMIFTGGERLRLPKVRSTDTTAGLPVTAPWKKRQ